jgi:hypothetical protein
MNILHKSNWRKMEGKNMFAYEPHLEPPCNYWEEYKKPAMIEKKIIEISKNITEKGNNTFFSEIFDYMYEYIEDNLEKFLSHAEYDDCE